jgi:selenocysteine lyase/cysteine desulfurase
MTVIDAGHGQPNDWRRLFDVEQPVPLLDGGTRTYVNLDNAASTPPLRAVTAAVNRFLPWYSSVHRGSGFKSQLATFAYEEARRTTMRFVGADPVAHVCIFGKNTTEALNKLARRFPFAAGRDTIIVSMMEHHSNDLPYRAVAHVLHVAVKPDGSLDEADYDRKLRQHGERVALVAITGGSNVTGIINPAQRLAAKAHAAGAHFLLDIAQLAPHRPVSMGSLDDPGHFDYVALSGHKLYAPFGAGALIGRRDTFTQGEPDQRGGGTVEIVTEDGVWWSGPPDREEAGSPNVVGAVALAAAIEQLQAVGMETVAAHEAELTAYALRRLSAVEDLEIIGDADPARAAMRLGVIPFNLRHVQHFLVASILGHEFGIGVRNGCFCAHPYILHLLGLDAAQTQHVRDEMLAHNRAHMPGLVRASFGLYNTLAEVDYLVEALTKIACGEYKGDYVQDRASGDYAPRGWQPDFKSFLR